ncbi:MAG: hypothetical protein HPY58_10415 [Firmicutes bacterium]|nr:hypothetical protein [Bacillota bacterium]
MNSVRSLVNELEYLRQMELVDSIQLIDYGKYTLKARIFIYSDLFIQVYRNDKFNTTNFALILGNQRIYGRDELGGEWHRHPFDAPNTHDCSQEGQQSVTLLEFWEEVEQIIEDNF